MPITTSYELDEVSPGDEVGTDATLVCCDEPMTAAADSDKYGDRTHTCGTCGAKADIDDLGLISDIRD